ncbi:MAG: peptidylprolyl isomerase [Sulfuricurvum sp.]|jgi:FKBP-type peptidyl-prolyl cis-trans isomerase SlyD|uniref:FKBP-type peptidyl-prolyl cis-trans isomerase n=1 Tax=Sulfuricurvum sp. TaxID=2025608 RepID=UPI0025DEB092|nr:peptidylprolyl isomerase [Sulfuricurvum sp.]MCK9372628.1 peptidylprolyl isomerase [Sulfuricurvum sp.]
MTITKDCIVTLDYHINDTEGNLLHEEEESLVYLHGNYGHIFPTVEQALEGKKIGESFTVTLSADKAFGNYDPSLVVTEALSELPTEVSVGMELDGYFDEDTDDVVIYTVTEIDGDHATLDGNHPLAGMDLVFEGTVLDIHEATKQEIEEILAFNKDH